VYDLVDGGPRHEVIGVAGDGEWGYDAICRSQHAPQFFGNPFYQYFISRMHASLKRVTIEKSPIVAPPIHRLPKREMNHGYAKELARSSIFGTPLRSESAPGYPARYTVKPLRSVRIRTPQGSPGKKRPDFDMSGFREVRNYSTARENRIVEMRRDEDPACAESHSRARIALLKKVATRVRRSGRPAYKATTFPFSRITRSGQCDLSLAIDVGLRHASTRRLVHHTSPSSMELRTRFTNSRKGKSQQASD
jgi:hypothetical protein